MHLSTTAIACLNEDVRELVSASPVGGNSDAALHTAFVVLVNGLQLNGAAANTRGSGHQILRVVIVQFEDGRCGGHSHNLIATFYRFGDALNVDLCPSASADLRKHETEMPALPVFGPCATSEHVGDDCRKRLDDAQCLRVDTAEYVWREEEDAKRKQDSGGYCTHGGQPWS